jgi:hypothetical protein
MNSETRIRISDLRLQISKLKSDFKTQEKTPLNPLRLPPFFAPLRETATFRAKAQRKTEGAKKLEVLNHALKFASPD